MLRDRAIQSVLEAIAEGEIVESDLTARFLSGFLGKTTSVLYHHFGSLDGFLYQVAQAGFQQLHERLAKVQGSGGNLQDLAESFVTFGVAQPTLYSLMFERAFDWERLRAQSDAVAPSLALWRGLVQGLEQSGVPQPQVSTRLLYAGLHGLVSLAKSGRANVGALDVSDRQMAISMARELASRLCGCGEKNE